MKNINWYWVNKSHRAMIAIEHTKTMSEKYPEEIKYSIDNSLIYTNILYNNIHKKVKNNEIVLKDIGSVEAILSCEEDNVAVLNFASYKEPGGGFINGSRAQEECLCHDSFLYNVLSQNKGYYEYNNKYKNKGLYTNRAIYSPKVRFEKDGKEKYCDVITCAAPNLRAASRYCGVSAEENSSVLRDRIHFILEIAKQNNIDTLILGAYGCGVFGQDATEVATIFMDYLQNEYTDFKKVIFAIPIINEDSTNYDAFKDVLKEE